MADDQTTQAEKNAEAQRKEDAGKKGVGFGGTLTDLGEADAKGVGAGK